MDARGGHQLLRRVLMPISSSARRGSWTGPTRARKSTPEPVVARTRTIHMSPRRLTLTSHKPRVQDNEGMWRPSNRYDYLGPDGKCVDICWAPDSDSDSDDLEDDDLTGVLRCLFDGSDDEETDDEDSVPNLVARPFSYRRQALSFRIPRNLSIPFKTLEPVDTDGEGTDEIANEVKADQREEDGGGVVEAENAESRPCPDGPPTLVRASTSENAIIISCAPESSLSPPPTSSSFPPPPASAFYPPPATSASDPPPPTSASLPLRTSTFPPPPTNAFPPHKSTFPQPTASASVENRNIANAPPSRPTKAPKPSLLSPIQEESRAEVTANEGVMRRPGLHQGSDYSRAGLADYGASRTSRLMSSIQRSPDRIRSLFGKANARKDSTSKHKLGRDDCKLDGHGAKGADARLHSAVRRFRNALKNKDDKVNGSAA